MREKKSEEHWFYKFMGTQIHECGTNQKMAHNNATQGCKWNVHKKLSRASKVTYIVNRLRLNQ